MSRDQLPQPQPDVAGLASGAAPEWLTAEAAATVTGAEPGPFTDGEYRARLDGVRTRMAGAGLDAMLVFRPSSVEYLCGYHTAETAPQPLLVTESDTCLYVPDLEVGRALATSRVGRIRFCGYADALVSLRTFLDDAAGGLGAGARVGVEVGHASTPPQAIEILRAREVEVVHPDHLVERVRLVHSAAEIGCVERAASVTGAGTDAAVAEAGRPEATDSSVAAAIAGALFERADSPSAWGPVVATGNRAGIPHSSWVGRRLAPGPTFLEFSGAHHRYHAPVMRTLVLGGLSPDDRRLAELSRAALAAVLEAAEPGVPCSEVAEHAWRAVGRLPGDVVFHGLFGYPVGLAHKPHWMDSAPFHIVRGNHEPLRSGMVFHVPASFRSFGRSGVGLSQTFVVEEHGARVLTPGRADVVEVG
ncbi:M24 family metallopeptidase [Streptomonospora wellingtoniae]|uniref:Xaa-Pro peptidase family protein n=1 Tax=Streptomonospora wellingtoniae TaxID=3075544 RepID=A0ABU2KN26_9ACTN|nr:Xaa-Pro peptidase family protein [Streptomonospora sp. DSM 45055]MDT0300654.1 Xaa-Pro peptidase family protein [Streptomonospora sp. DSM 45055]